MACAPYTPTMAHEHTFEIMEHTADVGVLGRGKTMSEAFENAAYGMFSVMADLGNYSPTRKTTVEAAGDDSISLLQRFLSSLIVLFEADGVLPLDFNITELGRDFLKCEVSVRPVADDIEWLGPQIKAVTYHQMAVEEEDGKWRAQAILDV